MDLSLKNQPRTSVKTQVFSVIITLIADSLDESLTQYFRFWRTTGFFPLGSHRSSSFVWEEQLSRKTRQTTPAAFSKSWRQPKRLHPFCHRSFCPPTFDLKVSLNPYWSSLSTQTQAEGISKLTASWKELYRRASANRTTVWAISWNLCLSTHFHPWHAWQVSTVNSSSLPLPYMHSVTFGFLFFRRRHGLLLWSDP